MKKIKGILITHDQIDKEGDIFTKEALDGIETVNKPILLNFDPTQIAGTVISQKRTSNGIEITAEINDKFWSDIKIGHGLGISGIIDVSPPVITKVDVICVSLVNKPCHDSWRVTEKENEK